MSSTASPRHPPPTFASSSRAHPYTRPSQRRSPRDERERLPPSPPISHSDSASPPVEKLDPTDNYWDDVPAPPASLKSILDSFRRSGEGDRDLLMAILGAKKSEEERLTSIIQTRLTILQARLNLAAIQAQMPAMSPEFKPPLERTSSMSAASGAESPRQQYYYQPREERERVQLPPIGFYGRDQREQREQRDRERERDHTERLPPMREGAREGASPRREPRDPSNERERAGGLEMLLEGVREAERKERV